MTHTTGRRLLWLLPGLGLVVLLALGALTAWRQVTRPEPGVTAGLPSNVPLATDKSLGINADLSRHDARAREEALVAMKAAGFRWLRQRFPWDAIEPEQGVYDWAAWDGIVEDTVQHNLVLVAVLDGSPEWARGEGDAANRSAPPGEAQDYGAFAAAFAARYGDRVDHYQIWDEPNIAPHWGARAIDPVAYGRLLREAATQIRAADPGAVILAAALAPNVEPGGANMSELLFLDALYQWGAAEWFDAVAGQLYDFEDPADAPPSPDRLNWRRAELLRVVMEANEDGETAMWAISFGLPGQDPAAVAKVLERARGDWPWLGPALWAAWSPDDRHGEYALTETGGQSEPRYGVLQRVALAPALAWPGVYPADHPSGYYEGHWRVTPFGADIGQSGDRLTIPFWGTQLDLEVRRGDFRAFLFVTVDGQPANALPQDPEGRAYVVLYDPLREAESVTLARGLPSGYHVAEISAERGWGQWVVAGWTVSRGMARHLPWLALGVGLAAVVTLGIIVHRAWPRRHSLLDASHSLVTQYRALDDRVVLLITAGAALLVYVTVGPVPSLATLGLLALLLLLCPDMGLPLIALALPFYQVGKPLLGKVFSMVEILILLTAVGWVANKAFGMPNRLSQVSRNGPHITSYRPWLGQWISRFTALDWGMVALVFVGSVSLLWADHSQVAAREFRTVILESALFYGLLRAMIRGRRDVWRVADAWVLGGVIIALVGLGQWALGHNLITAEGVWRVRGFYGSPNNLAIYLGRVLPLVVAVGAWGQRGSRRWLYGLSSLAIAVVIMLTYSRGAWLLGVPASLLFLAAMRGRRTLAVAIGLLLLAAVLVFFVVGGGRLTSLFDMGEGSTYFRLQLWQSSWAMVRDHPLLGVGLDNFLYQYRTRYVLPTAWQEFNLSHPHNLVLDFWLRLGLPGLVLFGWLVVAFFRRGWWAYRRLPDGNERLLMLGLMGGMVNVVAHGLVDNAFFLVDLAFAFVLMLALVQGALDG